MNQWVVAGVSLFLFYSCLEIPEISTDDGSLAVTELRIPTDFPLTTHITVDLYLEVLDEVGTPLIDIPIALFSGRPDQGAFLVQNGYTDSQGVFQSRIMVPTFQDTVYLVSGDSRLDKVFWIPLASLEPSIRVSTNADFATARFVPGENLYGPSFFSSIPSQTWQSFIPGKNMKGMLMYETDWPAKGDFDMNDMIISYGYVVKQDSLGRVNSIEAEFLLEAYGTQDSCGFAIELDIPYDMVQQVNGQMLAQSLIQMNPNGTERGHSKAVIPIFDLVKGQIGVPVEVPINTDISIPYFPPLHLKVQIVLSEPVSLFQLGIAPFNPFIFHSRTRSREIHLPDFSPTELADMDLFGIDDDASIPTLGRYYRTENNFGWALHLPVSSVYPRENRSISQAFSKLQDWTESGGIEYKDWYLNTEEGYRSPDAIFFY